jgi:hypothetical protein
MNAITEWLILVLGEVHARNHGDFAGLGLVFYTDLSLLPIHPLVPAELMPVLPTSTPKESIELLAAISRRSSICHDGFHLVDAGNLSITSVSQFLSPAIPHEKLAIPHARGARHMAAQLASLMDFVSLTAVCTSDSEVTLYIRGERRSQHFKMA